LFTYIGFSIHSFIIRGTHTKSPRPQRPPAIHNALSEKTLACCCEHRHTDCVPLLLRVLPVLQKAFQYRSQCTAKVSLEIYDIINFDMTSCCGYCNR